MVKEAELLKEIEHQRKRAHDSDSQFCWLARWCKEKFGIENNDVIVKDDWPNSLVEVVAKVVTERLEELEADNWWLQEYKKYIGDEISRGSMPMEFKVWKQTVDKLAKELEQAVKDGGNS